jgi:hypothetical protein
MAISTPLAGITVQEHSDTQAWCKANTGWRAEYETKADAAFLIMTNNESRRAARKIDNDRMSAMSSSGWHLLRDGEEFVVIDNGESGEAIAKTTTLAGALDALLTARLIHAEAA